MAESDDEASSSSSSSTTSRIVASALALFREDHYTESVVKLREAKNLPTHGPHECIWQTEKELITLLKDMLSEDRWKPSYTARGVTVSLDTARARGDRLLRVKCDGHTPPSVDLFCICACLFEIQCFPEWMPGVDEAIVEHTFSTFRKIVRVSGPKPWPFRRDECIVEAYGDVVDCSAILATSRRKGVAVYLKPAFGVPRTRGRHYAEITGGWFLEKRSDAGGVAITLVARIDPKLRWVPSWVVNFIIRNLAYLFIPMVADFGENFKPGGARRALVDDKPEIYDEIQRRLDKLEQQQQQQQQHHEENHTTPPMTAPASSPLLPTLSTASVSRPEMLEESRPPPSEVVTDAGRPQSSHQDDDDNGDKENTPPSTAPPTAKPHHHAGTGTLARLVAAAAIAFVLTV